MDIKSIIDWIFKFSIEYSFILILLIDINKIKTYTFIKNNPKSQTKPYYASDISLLDIVTLNFLL